MKKLIFTLSLIAAFAMTMPAFAAIDIKDNNGNKGPTHRTVIQGTAEGTGSNRTVFIDTLSDDDEDTLIQVEESADEDTIRMDIGGTEVLSISGNGIVHDDIVTASLSVAAEGSNEIAVTVTVQDNASATVAADRTMFWWLSDTAAAAVSGTAPNTDVTVSGGVNVIEHTTDKVGVMSTGSDGVVVFTLGDTGTPTFYLNVEIDGKIYSSAAITFA